MKKENQRLVDEPLKYGSGDAEIRALRPSAQQSVCDIVVPGDSSANTDIQ